jgi:hypothetical protein
MIGRVRRLRGRLLEEAFRSLSSRAGTTTHSTAKSLEALGRLERYELHAVARRKRVCKLIEPADASNYSRTVADCAHSFSRMSFPMRERGCPPTTLHGGPTPRHYPSQGVDRESVG